MPKPLAAIPDLGVLATVACDEVTHGPTTLDAGESLRMEEPLVDNIHIVSGYSLHVALYALQNPTPENIAKALGKLGVSGDCDEHVDPNTLLPLPVSKPPRWTR